MDVPTSPVAPGTPASGAITRGLVETERISSGIFWGLIVTVVLAILLTLGIILIIVYATPKPSHGSSGHFFSLRGRKFRAAAGSAHISSLNDWRTLWSEHILYTHAFIVASLFNNPDLPQITARLLKNQEDIGNFLRPKYGQQVADATTNLLKQHILLASDIVTDVKNNDTAKLAADQAKWEQNGRDIVQHMCSVASPQKPNCVQELNQHFMHHLMLLSQQLTAYTQGNYSQGLQYLKQSHAAGLDMANAMAYHLLDIQAPVGSGSQCEALLSDSRRLWSEHAALTHKLVASSTFRNPDLQAVSDTLNQNQTEIAQMFAQRFGDPVGQQLSNWLQEHHMIIAQLTTDAASGNQQALANDRARLQQNVQQFVNYVCNLNQQAQTCCGSLKNTFDSRAQALLDEISAYPAGQYANAVQKIDQGHNDLLSLSDQLVTCIFCSNGQAASGGAGAPVNRPY